MKAIQSNALAIVGAMAGGLVGYFGFFWLALHGFYGLALPGGVLGLGASIFRCRSISIPIVCGIAALGLVLVAEWRFAPFVIDGSLGYFITHFYQLSAVSLMMIAAGAAIGFWCPFRQYRSAAKA